MFIKIFTPNENGKIELTVKELEALIQEAVDKAVGEKCNNCSRYWYSSITTTPNITLLGDKNSAPSKNGEITWSWDKVTCNDCFLNESSTLGKNLDATNVIEDLGALRSSTNGQLSLEFDNTKEN